MTSKRPTLKTISELSGFAVPTVSRALKDAPDIRETTKARVRQIAAEIGYIPNRAGVRLRTGKTNVISVLLSTDHDAVDDHTGRLIASVAQNLRTTPYHMIVTPYATGEDRMEPIRYLAETRSADAVIMAQIEAEDPRVAYLMERGLPFATYGRSKWCRDHAYFDFDNGAFGEIAARRLIQKGRRRILLIAPPLEQSYSRHIIDGVRVGIAGSDARLEIIDGVTSHDTNAKVRTVLAERLADRSRPVDAIIAPSTTSAISSAVALEHVGLRLGQEIDMFAKEATPFLRFFRSEIETVFEDVLEAGRFLATAVVRRIEHPELPPMQALEVAREPRPLDSLF